MRKDDVEFQPNEKRRIYREIHESLQNLSNLPENLDSNFWSFFEIHQSPENWYLQQQIWEYPEVPDDNSWIWVVV